MEVKNPQAAILSNYEVLTLMSEMKLLGSSVNQESTQLATIVYETSHYLQELPCKEQSQEKTDLLLRLLKNFPIKLTKLEKLMLCNDPPKTLLQLCLIVKECEDIVSESEIAEDCENKVSKLDIQEWLEKINNIVS